MALRQMKLARLRTLRAARHARSSPSCQQSIAGIFDEAGGRLDSLLP